MLSLVKFKFGSLFTRIVLSFTILVMMIIVTITFLFSNLYSKTLYGQLSREQVKGLEMLSANIDNLFKEIDQVYLNMEINTDIGFFLASDLNDDLINNKARIQIRNMRQINPYIHSIFVYNSVINQYIVEGEPGFDARGFLRQGAAFLKSVNNKRAIYLTKLVKTEASRNFLTDKKANYVISMEYSNLNMKGEQQSVIINLDDELLVRDYLSKNGDQLLFADANGTLVAHSNVELIGDSVRSSPSFTAVQKAASDSGDVIDDDGSRQSLVAFVKNQKTGWYLLSFTPYHNLVAPIQNKRDGLLAVCLSILVLCVIVTFLISKKLYIPVRRLTEQFKRSEFHVGSTASNDISLIGHVYAETLQHMYTLQDKNRDSLHLLQDNLLRNVLTGANAEGLPFSAKADEYKLRIDLNHLRLCVCTIDSYSQLQSEKMTLYNSVLFKSVTEMLDQQFRYEALQMPKGELVLFINEPSDTDPNFSQLLGKLASIKDSIAATLDITISIGISDPIDAWGDCPQAYKQALDMLQQRFVLGHNRIIFPQLVEASLVRSYGLPSEIEEKLVSAIKRSHPESFAKGLDLMTNVLSGFVYTDAVQSLFHILLVCMTQMNQMINDENKRLGMPFGELNLMFSEMETLEQAKQWLQQRFADYCDNMENIKQLKENKFYRKIEETMQYIQANYRDSNLSVEVLADIAGYTPNYFSKLFKEVTGINSGEYIRRIRINRAKELLKNEDYKVNDVAEMCGYLNSSHFYSAFKKDVGLTPAAYREYAAREAGDLGRIVPLVHPSQRAHTKHMG